MKTIEERAQDFAIEKCCPECKHNSECKNNKSVKCGLVLRYDVMYQKIAKEQQEITKQEMIEKVEKYMKENIHQDFVFYSNKGWSLRNKFIDDLKSFLEE